jgi:hypothetical protein
LSGPLIGLSQPEAIGSVIGVTICMIELVMKNDRLVIGNVKILPIGRDIGLARFNLAR